MKIFLSYRREETAGFAGRIFDRLAATFGEKKLFMDVDTIRPGQDFSRVIESNVIDSDLLVALIGPNWIGSTIDGVRRIDDPEDFIRIEVDKASVPAGCRLAKHPTYKAEFIRGYPVFADSVTCQLR